MLIYYKSEMNYKKGLDVTDTNTGTNDAVMDENRRLRAELEEAKV